MLEVIVQDSVPSKPQASIEGIAIREVQKHALSNGWSKIEEWLES